MGYWDIISEAKVTTRSDNIRDGEYLFEVKSLLYKEMPMAGLTFVADLLVRESKSKGDTNPDTGAPVEPNAVGSSVGFVCVMSALPARGNMKQFICALFGLNPDTVSKEALEKLLSGLFGPHPTAGKTNQDDDVQEARGMLVRGSTYQKKVEKGARAGKTNTYCRFITVPQTEADVKGRRAAQAQG
jgi:hypothetical protein